MKDILNGEISETKNKILTVSLDLFSTQGFKGTSIREIANGVNIKASSIYNHFKSKDEILESLFSIYRPHSLRTNLLNNKYLEEIKENPDSFISIFSTEMIKIYKDEHWNKFYKLMVIEMFQNKTIEKLIQEKILIDAKKSFESFFDELKKNNLIKNIDSAILANELFTLIMSSNLEILMENNDLDYEIELSKKRLEFLWNSIKR